MTSANTPSLLNAESPDSLRFQCRLVLSVFGSFFLYAALAAPVPAVNEPHYLCKAKFYWDASWCAADFFLNSSNAHLVFYYTFGFLTQWLSLEQTAWFGRLIGLLFLATGWTALIRRIVGGRWSAVTAAWIFLLLASLGNLSGEWLIGGIESKVVAYAFVFWALALAMDCRWYRAALCAGLSIAYHPVVGLWSVIAAGWIAVLVVYRNLRGCAASYEQLTNRKRAAYVTIVSLFLLSLSAMPGLLPALSLLSDSSPKLGYQAHYIQVFYRLKHHLDPMAFSIWGYVFYAVLIGFWFVGRRHIKSKPQEIWWTRFVIGSGLIALAGWLIGFGPRPPADMPFFAFRMKLMRFYPFRVMDVMVPIAASIVTVGLIRHWLDSSTGAADDSSCRRRQRLLRRGLGGIYLLALLLASLSRHPSNMPTEWRVDWLDVCHWIETNTPRDALVITPREAFAFKWYAQRAEYVCFKDCPQDAPGIVEWNRRLKFLQKWAETNYEGGIYTSAAMSRLREKTGVTHVIARRWGPFEQEPIYANRTYRVYQLPFPLAESQP